MAINNSSQNNESVNIPVNIQVEGVEQSLDRIRDEFKGILATGKSLADVDFNNVETLEDMFNKANDEAQRMLVSFGKNSKQFKTAADNASKLRREVEAYDRTIDNMKMTGMQRFVTYSQTGLNMLIGLQGAMNAFGVESEDSVQAIAKLQGLMAFSQAIGELRTLTGTFALFSSGVISNNVAMGAAGATMALLGQETAALTIKLNALDATIIGDKNKIRNLDIESNAIGEKIQQLANLQDVEADLAELGLRSSEEAQKRIDLLQKEKEELGESFTSKQEELKLLEDKLKAAAEEAGVIEENIRLTTESTLAANGATVATTRSAKALGVLKNALTALGIGALIVLLGVVVAYWEDISDWIGITTKATQNYNKALKEMNDDLAENTVKFDMLSMALKTANTQQKINNLSTNEARRITKLYNETLGETYGKVKNAGEALDGFAKYADRYMTNLKNMVLQQNLFNRSVEITKEILDIDRKAAAKDYTFMERASTFPTMFTDPGKEINQILKEKGELKKQQLQTELSMIAMANLISSPGITTGTDPDPDPPTPPGGGRSAKEQKDYLTAVKEFYARVIQARQDYQHELDNLTRSEREVELADEKKLHGEKLALLDEYHKLYNDAVKNDPKNANEYKKLILLTEDEIKQSVQAISLIEKKWNDVLKTFMVDNSFTYVNEFDARIAEMNKSVEELGKNMVGMNKIVLQVFAKNYENYVREMERLTEELNKSTHEANMKMFDLNAINRVIDGASTTETFDEQKRLADEKAKIQFDIADKEREERLAQIDLEEKDEKKRQRRLLESQAQFEDDKSRIAKETSDTRTKIDNAEYSAKMALAQASASALGSLGDLAAEGTAEWKALKIAEATISTIAGATDAFNAAQSIPVYGFAIGVAQAIAVSAAGLANIKKIASTKIPGKANSGGAVVPLSLPSSVMNPLSANGIQDVRVLNNQDVVVRNTISDKELADSRQRSDFQNSMSDF